MNPLRSVGGRLALGLALVVAGALVLVDLIVVPASGLDFDDQFGAEGLPFAGAFGAPAARAAGCLAGEAAALFRRLSKLFDLRRELLPLAGGEG